MGVRALATVCLWGILVVGLLAMPVSLLISAEDGPMPADQLWRQKAIARTVLLTGGVVAMLAASGLYAVSRLGRRAGPGSPEGDGHPDDSPSRNQRLV
jgi:hypothetical protein